MATCSHCGGTVEYAQEVLGDICTQCGVLVDGTQTVLETDEFEPGHASGSSRSGYRIRSYRDPTRSLPGDSASGERHAINTAASHAFIHSLATQLGLSAHAERATGIFTQAMTAGKYKWGRRATSIACAALGVALREASKPHFLPQISHVANVSFASLSRTYARVTELLKLRLPLSHPLDSIPAIHKHTLDLIDADPPVLSAELQQELERALGTKKERDRRDDSRARETSRLASCLASLELPPGHHHVTACAVYVLAVEGTRRAKLPAFRALADHLAHRAGAGVKATRARYNELAKWLYARVAAVPWLKHTPTRQKKVDERDVVARALSDLLKFHTAIISHPTKSSQETPLPFLRIDPDSDADEDSCGSEAEETPLHASRKRKADANELSTPTTAPKKPRKANAADAAVQSLLVSGGTALGHGHDLHAYYLTCSDQQLEQRRPPSRLDLLCATRGGEEAVEDDELFADGELDEILRTEDEREAVLRVMHEEWAYVPKSQQQAAEPKGLRGEKKRTKAGEGWERALDIALGHTPAVEEGGDLLVDDWFKSDEGGKAAPWDEDISDRNWAPTLDDAHDWLADF